MMHCYAIYADGSTSYLGTHRSPEVLREIMPTYCDRAMVIIASPAPVVFAKKALANGSIGWIGEDEANG